MKAEAVVVCIDPGKATGVVVASVWRKPAGIEPDVDTGIVAIHRLFNKYAVKFTTIQTVSYENIYPDLMKIMQEADNLGKMLNVPVKLIGEAFIITNTAQRGASTWSLEIIGGSKALNETCFQEWRPHDFGQKSSDAKSIITNTVLKDCGLTKKALNRVITPHEQDAMRHMLLHVARIQSKKTVW